MTTVPSGCSNRAGQSQSSAGLLESLAAVIAGGAQPTVDCDQRRHSKTGGGERKLDVIDGSALENVRIQVVDPQLNGLVAGGRGDPDLL
jgi:hypothetical protein